MMLNHQTVTASEWAGLGFHRDTILSPTQGLWQRGLRYLYTALLICKVTNHLTCLSYLSVSCWVKLLSQVCSFCVCIFSQNFTCWFLNSPVCLSLSQSAICGPSSLSWSFSGNRNPFSTKTGGNVQNHQNCTGLMVYPGVCHSLLVSTGLCWYLSLCWSVSLCTSLNHTLLICITLYWYLMVCISLYWSGLLLLVTAGLYLCGGSGIECFCCFRWKWFSCFRPSELLIASWSLWAGINGDWSRMTRIKYCNSHCITPKYFNTHCNIPKYFSTQSILWYLLRLNINIFYKLWNLSTDGIYLSVWQIAGGSSSSDCWRWVFISVPVCPHSQHQSGPN